MSMNSNSRHIVAVAGGIGSGKSVVCQVLMAMGYEVYDCDSRAKWLMDNSPAIKQAIAERISPLAISAEGDIRRYVLSKIVFSDAGKLKILNEITHQAVREDIARWVERPHRRYPLFIETAILYESRLDAMVHEVWEVTAPTALRVERVMRRSALTREQVLARISAQSRPASRVHPCISLIINDNEHPLLPQIHALLGE